MRSTVDEMVVRIGMTGALTWGGQHLESLGTWEDHPWRVSEEEMREWIDDPEPNPARDRAYALAERLLGIRI